MLIINNIGVVSIIYRRGERPLAPTGFGGVHGGSITNNRDDVNTISLYPHNNADYAFSGNFISTLPSLVIVISAPKFLIFSKTYCLVFKSFALDKIIDQAEI